MTSAHTNERPAPAATDAGQGSRATSKRNHRQGTAGQTLSDSLLPPRLGWAATLIDRATDTIPEYGSAEFEALPDDAAEKVASCVRAAEAWRVYFSPEEITRRLQAELEAAHLANDEPPMWSRDVVDAVHRMANRPSFAELSVRRGEPERAERANEHRRRMGLPVVERAPLRLVTGG